MSRPTIPTPAVMAGPSRLTARPVGQPAPGAVAAAAAANAEAEAKTEAEAKNKEPEHHQDRAQAATADISALRAAGGDAAVSFGGYNGTELGSSCGSASALAAAYQQVITKYQLKHVDFDYENTALDSNTAVRFGAIKILEQNNPNLVVSLTIPMTTVGFPGSGTDEIKQAVAAGARLDVINIMDFDTGLTSGTEVGQTEAIANDAVSQLQGIYGWSAAQAWSHLGLQIMNGHTDQPSELFAQSDFSALLGFAQANHPAWFSYWSANRDRACDPSVVHNWADGTCSSVSQNPWDFTKILVQYNG